VTVTIPQYQFNKIKQRTHFESQREEERKKETNLGLDLADRSTMQSIVCSLSYNTTLHRKAWQHTSPSVNSRPLSQAFTFHYCVAKTLPGECESILEKDFE